MSSAKHKGTGGVPGCRRLAGEGGGITNEAASSAVAEDRAGDERKSLLLRYCGELLLVPIAWSVAVPADLYVWLSNRR